MKITDIETLPSVASAHVKKTNFEAQSDNYVSAIKNSVLQSIIFVEEILTIIQ